MVLDQQKPVVFLPEMYLQIFFIIERFFAENTIVILFCTHDSIRVKSLLIAYSGVTVWRLFSLYTALIRIVFVLYDSNIHILF